MCFNGYIWQLIATFWHITYKMFPRGQTNTETSLQPPFINWSCLVCQRNPKASVGTGDVLLGEKVDAQGLRFLL